MSVITSSPPEVRPPGGSTASFGTAAMILIAIAALYLGQGIFVPLVLAVLVAFALAPVVSWLRRLHIPHVVAVMIAVTVVAMLIALIGYLVITQLLKLASDLPQYQQTIGQKLRALQQTAGGGDVLERMATTIERLGNQVGVPTEGADASGREPIPVIITNTPQVPLAGIQSLLGSLLGPLATGAIVTIFVIFLLLQREDLRDRFLKLVSRGDLRTSTKVMNESGARVSRYLLVQFCVNAVYGIVFGIGLTLLGVPNAILWGLFATLFRYIPFVGTLMAAAFPAALSFAVDPGWSMLAGLVALYVTIELITTNAIEPRLYGSSTGISPLAVLVAAIFWATLWGPMGLILSTPLTVCLVVLGRYVPQLNFLEVLLGSDPVLSNEERFYQRLLAGNIEEAVELAETQLKDSPPREFYDHVALPALRLAEADLQHNAHDLGPRRTVVDTISGVTREVMEISASAARKQGTGQETPIDGTRPKVLVIGGKTELDGAVAEMLAQIITHAGAEAQMLPPITIRQEGLRQLDLTGVEVVCLCYLGSNARSFVRYAARHMRRRSNGELRVLAGLFGITGEEDLPASEYNVDAIARSFLEAETQILQWMGRTATDASSEAEDGAIEEESSALKRLQGLARLEGWLDERLAGIAAEFSVPLAFATIIDVEHLAHQTVHAGPATEDQWNANSLAEQVAASGETLVIENVASHKLYSDNPFLLENGIQFYAGAPLVTINGRAVGALSVVDADARKFTEQEQEKLRRIARELMAELEAKSARQVETSKMAVEPEQAL